MLKLSDNSVLIIIFTKHFDYLVPSVVYSEFFRLQQLYIANSENPTKRNVFRNNGLQLTCYAYRHTCKIPAFRCFPKFRCGIFFDRERVFQRWWLMGDGRIQKLFTSSLEWGSADMASIQSSINPIFKNVFLRVFASSLEWGLAEMEYGIQSKFKKCLRLPPQQSS